MRCGDDVALAKFLDGRVRKGVVDERVHHHLSLREPFTIVASLEAQHGRQVPACAVPSHRDAFWVALQVCSVGSHPFEGRVSVVKLSGVGVLGRESVPHGVHLCIEFPGKVLAQASTGPYPHGGIPTAVKEEHSRPTRLGGLGGEFGDGDGAPLALTGSV